MVVVGQDGLTDGTPVQVLKGPGSQAEAAPSDAAPSRAERRGDGGGRPGARGPRGGGDFDINEMTPEQLARMKARMKERGMTDEQIEAAIERRRQRSRQ